MASDIEKRWMAAWKEAAPILEKIKSDELRSLPSEAGAETLGCFWPSHEYENGLVVFQGWMQRQRILQLSARVAELEAELKELKSRVQK